MAALTQQQWFEKIKKFVPETWIKEEKYNPTILGAIAAVFAQVDQDSFDQWNTTYLLNAVGPFVDLFGDEREIARLPNESDQAYQRRIQRITSQSDVVSIKAVVDSLLLIPGCKILQSCEDNIYFTRKSFISRDNYLSAFYENYFIIIVPKQVHDPYSFTNRSTFLSRLNFDGSDVQPTTAFTSVIAITNYMKAFGVLYRIVETDKRVIV